MKDSFKYLLLLLVIVSACSPKTGPSLRVKKDIAERPELDFEHLSVRAKTKFDDGKQKLNATAHIRMAKDEITWVSVTAFLGIEAARVLFGTDSLVFLNNLQKQARIEQVADFEERAGFQIQPSQVQGLILGRLPFELKREDVVSQSEGKWLVSQNRGRINALSSLDSTLLLQRQVLYDSLSGAKLSAVYSEYQVLENGFVPGKSSMEIMLPLKDGGFDTLHLDFQFLNWDVKDGTQDYSFSIPSGYELR